MAVPIQKEIGDEINQAESGYFRKLLRCRNICSVMNQTDKANEFCTPMASNVMSLF